MILHFTRKDSGEKVSVSSAHVVTYNKDADGVGTMIVLTGCVLRPVSESYDVVDGKVCHALKH